MTEPYSNLAGRTALVVEDHPDFRDLLADVLRSLRSKVIAAGSIAAAQRLLSVRPVHLVACDMKLPDGTGLDLIRWIRSHQGIKELPCIAVTGHEQHFPANAAEGFNAYMRKPINVDRFCAVAVALVRP